MQSASCAIGSSRNTVATAAEEATVADEDHLPPDDGDEDEGDDGEEQRLPTAAELRQVSDLLCSSDYQQEKAEREREAQRIAEDTLMRQAGMLAAEAEFKAKARFGIRPAGKITMEGDGVGCGKNRVLCEATQVATKALSVKVNAKYC